MGIFDRFRKNNKKKIVSYKQNYDINLVNKKQEDKKQTYEIEKTKRKEKLYNLILNSTDVDKIINVQISAEYLKYSLNKVKNDLTINETKKKIIIDSLNKRINYIENNLSKYHNDKMNNYLKELDIQKKQLKELENELENRRKYLESISEIEHYSNSGYLDIYDEIRNIQKKINLKKEEIRSILRNIQKERDIIRTLK